MKTIKRSQLNGVTGWLAKDGVLRICSMKTRWHRDGECGATIHTDDECKRWGDAPLTGDSLIAALRERGVEVIDDTQPALGGPNDAAARKWAEDRGYQIVAYRLPRNQEYYIANGDLHKVAAWHIDQAMSDWVTETRYILTPKAKPVETPATTEADQLSKELDEAWATIDELNGKLDAIEQPPMSDERFRQEAAIAAMGGMIARDAERVATLESDAEYYAKAANALLAAMKGGAQ
jgi:hypothetical protein